MRSEYKIPAFEELVDLVKKFPNKKDFVTWVNAKYDISQDKARMFHVTISSNNISMAKELHSEILQQIKENEEREKQYELENEGRLKEIEEENRLKKQMYQDIHEMHDIVTKWNEDNSKAIRKILKEQNKQNSKAKPVYRI